MWKGTSALILRDLMALPNKISSKPLHPKCYPAFLVIIHNRYPVCQRKETVSITKDEQMAIVSFLVINYIRQFKSQNYLKNQRSIRERLIDGVSFQQFIKNKLVQIGHSCNSLEDIGLMKESIDQVLKGFKWEQGAQFDPEIFNIQKMAQASFYKTKKQNGQSTAYVTLSPTIYSSSIISKLLQDHSFTISGSKGIGKSFSYLLYAYLSSFVLKWRATSSNFGKNPKILEDFLKKQVRDDLQWDKFLTKFVKDNMTHQNFQKQLDGLMKKRQKQAKRWQGIHAISKIFYFPLKDINSRLLQINMLKQATELTQIQRTQILQKVSSQSDRGRLKILVYTICRKYYSKGIGVIIVADQAEIYYKCARKYFQHKDLMIVSNDPNNSIVNPLPLEYCKQKNMLFDQIMTFSKCLQALYQSPRLILNSSEQTEESKSLQSNLKQYNLFNFYDHDKDRSFDLKLSHSEHLDKAAGQYELYMIFWFEISLHLINNNLPPELMETIKNSFAKTFKLSDKKLYVKWNFDITFFDIRQYLKIDYHLSAKQFLLVTSSLAKQQKEQIIIRHFQELKKSIQKYQQDQIQSKLEATQDKEIDLSKRYKRVHREI